MNKTSIVNVGTLGHIDHGKAGLTPRGQPMPQNADEWEYLARLYADKILEDKVTMAWQKQRINVLEQRLSQNLRANAVE